MSKRHGATWWLFVGWWWLLIGWWWPLRRRSLRAAQPTRTHAPASTHPRPASTLASAGASGALFTVYLITDEAETASGLVCEGCEPFRDKTGGRMLGLDEFVPDAPGVFYARVAGVGHHAANIQHACFSPGSKLVLLPEPDNPADPNAVQVIALDGTIRRLAGYLPATLASALPKSLRCGGGNAVVVQTFSKGGRRVGLRIVGTFGRPLAVESV